MPAERTWPRLLPYLRDVRDVPMGELRAHPDFVPRLKALAPAPTAVKILMGAPVLVARSGVIYAVAMGTHRFVLRRDARDPVHTATPTRATFAPAEESLGAAWSTIDFWLDRASQVERDAALAALRAEVALAASRAETATAG